MAWSSASEAEALLDEADALLNIAAPRHRHPVLSRLLELDDALAAHGFPRISPWWWDTLERFYLSHRRQFVGRVGRRGGKSSTLCRVAVAEATHGEHHIMPGDIGFVSIVSVDRKEAAARLHTIKQILDATGTPHRPIDGGMLLEDRPVGFRVYTASISGVSGFTSICALCDEVSKWRDYDTGANPATEVLASLRPTMATMPNARRFLSSSPLGNMDAHARAYDEGDTARQLTAHAPTWIANPTLTEEWTHTDEPDEDKWRREYAAIPMEGTEASLLSPALLDRAERHELDLPPADGHFYVAAMDPATRGNRWALVVACKRLVEGRIRRSLVLVREWRGTRERPLDPFTVLGEIAALLRPYGLDTVVSDQHHGDSLRAIGARLGLHVLVEPITHVSRDAMLEGLATGFADGDIEIPPHPLLRVDLLSILRVLTATGFTFRYSESPDGRHADMASAAAVALARPMRPPLTRDPRTEAQQIQDHALEQARKRYGTANREPFWKRKQW